MATNPYQVIIDLKLEGDYLSQEACIELMKEFAKRETNSICVESHQMLLKAYSRLSNTKDEQFLKEMRSLMEKLLCN